MSICMKNNAKKFYRKSWSLVVHRIVLTWKKGIESKHFWNIPQRIFMSLASFLKFDMYLPCRFWCTKNECK